MIQMNLSMKQTHKRTEQTCGCQEGEGVNEKWRGSLGLANKSIMYRMSNQQGPTI